MKLTVDLGHDIEDVNEWEHLVTDILAEEYGRFLHALIKRCRDEGATVETIFSNEGLPIEPFAKGLRLMEIQDG